MVVLKSPEEIDKIRRSCMIVSEVLQNLERLIAPGINTAELDTVAHDLIIKRSAKPAFLGYKGYPSSICASINDVIVHGIPNSKVKLKEGDIVSLDIGVYKDGFYGDAARTFAVGAIDPQAKKLLSITAEALSIGIKKVIINNRLHDISAAIQRHVEEHGFSIVRDFVGHGIGRALHEDPPIPNYGVVGTGPKLEVGMVLAIEPMVNEGKAAVKIDKDGWTARTQDGKRSAHFEHCVAVTENGPLILTQ